METHLIRPATASDISSILPMVQKICDMHRTMDPQRYPFVSDVAERYRGWLRTRSEDADSVLLVAVVADNVVGFIVGEILDEIPVFTLTRYGFLHDLWVEPPFRRRGIARALLIESIAKFKARGISQIRGDTAGKNHESRAMLESLGFHASTILMVHQQ